MKPKQKKELYFDPAARRKYLTGFKSRKKLRKKNAKQQKLTREKEFQKEIKQEKKKKIKEKLKEYGLDEDQQSQEESRATSDQLDSNLVVVVDTKPSFDQR